MRLAPAGRDAIIESSHRVIREAKAAGVHLFSGGIDENVDPVMVHSDGSATADTSDLDGGFCVIEVPTRIEAERWAARIAQGCHAPQELREFGEDPESSGHRRRP